MKTKLLLLGVIALLASCGQKYTITVNCDESADGRPVILYDLKTGEAIDTAIIADGVARFEGRVDKPQLGRMLSPAFPQRTIFVVLENGNIVCDGAISGTPQNDALQQFITEDAESQQSFMEIYRSLDRNDADFAEKVQNLGREMREAHYGICLSAIEKNPNTCVQTAALLNWLPTINDIDEFDKAAAFVSDEDLEYADLQNCIEVNNAKKATAPGQMFTDFTIENGNLDGTSVSLSDYVGKGKYVLVDFWASWCGPCRAEIPNVKEIYKDFAGDRFEIVSVAVWDRHDATLQAIEDLGLTWPQIIDAGEIPTSLYGIPGIPQIILFAPDGTIVARDLRGEHLRNTVANALGE